jgi:hypothetical protein
MLKFAFETWYYNLKYFNFGLQLLIIKLFSYLLKLLCSLIKNSVALVRERTIVTNRLTFVSEVSDKFCG